MKRWREKSSESRIVSSLAVGAMIAGLVYVGALEFLAQSENCESLKITNIGSLAITAAEQYQPLGSDTSPATIVYSFGDGNRPTPISVTEPAGLNPTPDTALHTYTQAGTYNVVATIENQQGSGVCSSEATAVVRT